MLNYPNFTACIFERVAEMGNGLARSIDSLAIPSPFRTTIQQQGGEEVQLESLKIAQVSVLFHKNTSER